MVRALALIIYSLVLASCSAKADIYTLYRNSSLDHQMRVHWATFDAHESDRDYNRNNCQMAARLLNANVSILTGNKMGVGFWCEFGKYSEAGAIPEDFDKAFPTDVPLYQRAP